MKIHTVKPEFQPVTIVLETPEEVQAFYDLLNDRPNASFLRNRGIDDSWLRGDLMEAGANPCGRFRRVEDLT